MVAPSQTVKNEPTKANAIAVQTGNSIASVDPGSEITSILESVEELGRHSTQLQSAMYNTSINPNLKYHNKLGGKHQTMVNFEIGPKVNVLWKQVQPVDFLGVKKGISDIRCGV